MAPPIVSQLRKRGGAACGLAPSGIRKRQKSSLVPIPIVIAASEEGPKFLHSESGLSDQAAEQTRAELPVKRHGEDDGGFGLDEADVPPPLAPPPPAGPFKGSDRLFPRAHGKHCHGSDSPSASERAPGGESEERAERGPRRGRWRGARG